MTQLVDHNAAGRSDRDRRIVVFETIGCALALRRRLDYVLCGDDVRETLTEVDARGRAVEDQRKDRRMKIYSIEVETDLGRRVVQLSAPLDVNPLAEMPPQFRSLTEVLWEVLQGVARKGAELAASAPKAEA